MRRSPVEKIFQTLLSAVILLMVFGADGSGQMNLEMPDISKRINSFAMALLKQHAATTNLPANTILSPQSIFHCLAMSYIASGGDTRDELARVFCFPEDNQALLKDLAGLRQQLHKADTQKRIDIALANSAWLDETYADFRQELQMTDLLKYYA